MLMLIVRGLSLATAVGTAIPVATGAMSDPAFVVADLILAALLTVGALVPGDRARAILLIGNAYALGVFSVALGNQAQPGGALNPLLVAVMVICAVCLVLLVGLKGGYRQLS